MPRWLLAGLLYAGFWTVILLGFAAHLVFSASFTWSQGMRGALFDWLPWVVLSPAVIWLARRFPLERGWLRWSVPVHAAGCFLVMTACSLISHQLLPRPDRARLAPPPHFAGPPHEIARGDPGPGAMLRRRPANDDARGSAEPRPRTVRIRRAHQFWAVVFWARSRINLPVYWVIVSVAHAFSFYRRAQERDRRALELSASLSQAKLQSLRLQLQPHFLFNTLNAISTLVHKDADKADEMIANLGELLRLSLDVTEQEIPLRHELEVLDHYLAIEQARLGERLSVRREIDPETLDARVPSLMLQTLVENAVRHGIEPRAAPGQITLRSRRSGEALQIEIVDDGAGLDPAARDGGRRGIGIANTELRLFELYGAAGRMILGEPPEGGVSVELSLPFHRSDIMDTGSGPVKS
ncbi:MAG: sensor histidine kinase [Opitutaceae bacterium]